MDVVGAFQRVDNFHIHHMTDHVILVRDAVGSVHVAAKAGDIERLAGRVALHQADHLRRHPVLIAKARDAEA